MKSPNRLSLVSSRLLSRPLSGLVLALFAGFAGLASAADIRIDDRVVEPLPGRDYSMRLDLAAARFEQIDAQSGEIRSRVFSAECAAALAPGLWLAVPADTGLDLLPVGVTVDHATAVAPGCRTAPGQAATLPPALLQQIAAAGGGVIFVNNAALDAAAESRVAVSEAAR
ncbi:hypothetical protein [Tahibacter sp.]|uniref:hypothetical protein n=1 Tax=Tahibacter sp. TaxID=2056211 RepID=UPI0028C3DBC9|nr:hypothetical protein [Tahibacter sp.]